ncbi:MAG: chromate resistance protein [Pseudorhodoplanes sp.]|jgi:rhodanese-related sulfurtransferase|nr:chromate resistance protein [Pseudorhodoplanes sp.]
MRAARFFISPQELWILLGGPEAPRIIDTRRHEVLSASPGVLPTSSWRDPSDVASWMPTLDRDLPVVLVCKEGHARSQTAAAFLREQGFEASVLSGGYEAWIEAGLPLVSKAALERFVLKRPSLWVTRRRPKIDRVACPWLIRRFIDRDARFLFVEPPDVRAVAQETGAVPFDIEGVELSHEGERCSFDTLLKAFGLEDLPALARLALIVRGADTARPDLAPEASGLLAVSLGLSALADDNDHGLLERGFVVYDALYAWLRFAAEERHNWPAKAA